MKPAWLWIAFVERSGYEFHGAQLLFSSPQKARKITGYPIYDLFAEAEKCNENKNCDHGVLFPVIVKDDFDHWDYIPDNY